jgi:hypothetical protein
VVVAIVRSMSLFLPIFEALEAAQVRYVTVGGVAVVLHGHPRLTADLDLIVDLEPQRAEAAIDALVAIGFRPRLPVDTAGFADPAVRRSWIEEKGMTVFSLWDPDDPTRAVDLFVRQPIPFEELWARSRSIDLGTVHARVASIDDLIAMKMLAGRPVDLEDVEALSAIRDREGTDDG